MLLKLIPKKKGPFDAAGEEEVTVYINPDEVHTFFPIPSGTRLFMTEGHQVDVTNTFDEVVKAKEDEYVSRYPTLSVG